MTKQEIEKELSYAYFFKSIPGIGDKFIDMLRQYYGSYEKIYYEIIERVTYQNKKQHGLCKPIERSCFKEYSTNLKQTSNSFQTIYNRIFEHINNLQIINSDYTQVTNKFFRDFSNLEKLNMKCYARGVDGYPTILDHIPNAPSMLFVKGYLPNYERPTVAIIGARNCSQYGSVMAKLIGERLAQANINVVSGLARGIDGISQHAALNAGGATFGVLGCGADICYPEENFELYNSLAAGINNGGIISEFLPGTQAQSNHFPMRNRIISGLSDAVIVIEAKEKSGTFITVNQALEQGKNVYAVPGRVCDMLSFGCNRLINDGAGILWNIDEFINEVYYEKEMTREVLNCTQESAQGNAKGHDLDTNQDDIQQMSLKDLIILRNASKLSDIQRLIIQEMDLDYCPLDLILCKLTMPIQELLKNISELENMHLIESENGYFRIKT